MASGDRHAGQGGEGIVRVPPVRAPTMRAGFVLQLAEGLVETVQDGVVHAEVVLATREGTPRATLCSDASPLVMERVAAGEVLAGIVNPAALLAVARRGVPPFSGRLPLRTVVTIPSPDVVVLVVRPGLEVSSVEELVARRVPLRISLRGGPEDGVNWVLDHVLAAVGTSLADIRAGGGVISRDEGIPPRGGRLAALVTGEVDAVFDEAVDTWLDAALHRGCTVLSVGPPALERLEEWGYRRALVRADEHPDLGRDVPTLDFSDWPLYVREDAPAALVEALCAIVDAKRAVLPWEGDGPLPAEPVSDGTAAPSSGAVLHDAAASYWRSKARR